MGSWWWLLLTTLFTVFRFTNTRTSDLQPQHSTLSRFEEHRPAMDHVLSLKQLITIPSRTMRGRRLHQHLAYRSIPTGSKAERADAMAETDSRSYTESALENPRPQTIRSDDDEEQFQPSSSSSSSKSPPLSIFLPLSFSDGFSPSTLDKGIELDDLEVVNLRRMPRGLLPDCKRVKWGGDIQLHLGSKHSSGAAIKCSSYWQCDGDLSGISACLDESYYQPRSLGSEPPELANQLEPAGATVPVTYDEYSGGMVVLSDVYTNGRAQTFTRTRVFEKGGCSERMPHLFNAKKRMQVWEFDIAVNLMHGAGNFYHQLIETLPRFVLALPMLQALDQVPVLISYSDVPFMGLLSLIGLDDLYKRLNVYVITPRVLVRAKTLLVPFSPPCGQASAATWRIIRERHMGLNLPPLGASPFPPPAEDRAARWIVIGQRKGSRVLLEFDELRERLERAYGRERIRVFGSGRRWSPREAFDLFRNAALYIAPHGAGLSNMVFMPPGASVVEIRPMRYSNPCYHFLADAMNHAYFRLDVDGTKSSNLSVDVPRLMSIIASAAALSL